MANLNRVREPLELAAASSDPVVRRLALRFMEMKREIEALDAFFALYSSGDAPKMIAAPIEPAPTAGKRGRPKGSATRGEDALGATLRSVLERTGLPLDLDAFHIAYGDVAGGVMTRTAFRAAVTRRADQIERLADKRYWPVGMALPGNTLEASGGQHADIA